LFFLLSDYLEEFMAKVKHRIGALLVLTLLWCGAWSQAYPVRYSVSPADSAHLSHLSLPSFFATRFEANTFFAGLLPLLQSKGYITASLDSVQIDSTSAFVSLFLGEPFQWNSLRTDERDAPVLEAVRFPAIKGKMDFSTLHTWQKRILDYLEEEGYPFGKTYLDSIEIRTMVCRPC
jgi:hypothetical protein